MTEQTHSTTILCIKNNNQTTMIGDGQVSLGCTILKSNAHKIKYLNNDQTILAGFAGASADAFALFERLEIKLELYSNQLRRACIELAKDWRTDKYLRRLEAMMIVADSQTLLLVSGNGEVIEPEDNIIAIGSGGYYALAAAKALLENNSDLSLEKIAQISMKIAADICIYTNHNTIIKTIKY